MSPNAGRVTVLVATPPVSTFDPSWTVWPFSGPLVGTTVKSTLPVASAGVTVAVSVTDVPYCTVATDVLSVVVEAMRIFRVKSLVVTTSRPSVSCTVKDETPAAVGVPEIRPAASMPMPAGRAPVVNVQVKGEIPPDLVNCLL